LMKIITAEFMKSLLWYGSTLFVMIWFNSVCYDMVQLNQLLYFILGCLNVCIDHCTWRHSAGDDASGGQISNLCII
jgi:hypothetical protein